MLQPRLHPAALPLIAILCTSTPATADPVTASTLGWAINGIVSEVARAGDVAYVGGSFGSVAPAANLVHGFATFAADSAMPVLPRLDINGRVRAVVALPGGGWLIGGEFTQVNGQSRDRLARLTATGALDPAFNVQVSGGHVLALAAQGSTVFVGGDFTAVNAVTREGLAAIDATTGFVEDAFAPGLDAGSSTTAVLAIVPTATAVYVGGFFASVNGVPKANLAALNPTSGAALPAFAGTADGTVSALALAGSSLYAAGMFDSIGGAMRKGVARLDAATGAAVVAFDATSDDDVVALAVTSGAVFVAGGFNNIGGAPRRYLARLDPVTGLASSWNPEVDGDVDRLAVTGGTLVVAGWFRTIGGASRLHLAALDAAAVSPTVLSWNPSLSARVEALHIDAAGFVFASGSFTHFGAVPRENLAAIDLRSGGLLPWRPGANGWVRALEVVGNTVYIGGDFLTLGGGSRHRIAAVDAVTGALRTWTANPNGPVYGLAVVGDVVYFVGAFSSIKNSTSRGRGAAVGVDDVVRPWDPAADGDIEALAVAGSRVYLGGEFTMLGAENHLRLGAVDATTGAPETSFAPSVSGPVYRVDVLGDLVFLGGAFNMVNSTSRANAAAVKGAPGAGGDGQLQGWHPNVGGPVYDLDAFGDDVYLAGGFGSVGGSSRPGIAMVDALAAGGALRAWKPVDVSGGNVSVIDTSDTAVLFGGMLNDLDGVSIGAVLYPEAGLRGSAPPPTTPSIVVRGSRLEMDWGAPPLGARPASYVIEGGRGPGLSDLANFNTGSTATAFGLSGLGPGTYYVRMRSANGFGVSAPTVDQAFVVGAAGCSGPPAPALDLSAAVASGTVQLMWRASPQSIVSNYRLLVGTTSGGTQVGAFDVGAVTSFSATAPPGAFFVRVVAMNACGLGAPSAEAVAVVGGAVVPPGAPFGLEAALSGSTVSFTWGAPSAGTGPFAYRLEAGSATGLSNIANVTLPAPSFVVPGVPPGIYYVRVRALGGGVAVGPASNEVVIVVP